nr:YSIRK-type signal peptide-containing protein [Streptococcus sobrinus]
MSLEKHHRYSLRKLKFGLASVAVAAFLTGTAGLVQADETSSQDQDNQTDQNVSSNQNVSQETTNQADLNQTAVAADETADPKTDEATTQSGTKNSETQSSESSEVAEAENQTTQSESATRTFSLEEKDFSTATSEASQLETKDLRADAATTHYKNTFVDDGQGNWYYLDSNGNNVTGSQTIQGKELYFAQDGKQVKGQEVTINGKVYYYDQDSGEKWVNRFRMGKDDQTWFYYGSDGARVAGAQEINGQNLYFDPDTGKQAKGVFATDSDGKHHYYDKNSGAQVEDRFVQVSGKWYYLDSDGAPVTGEQEINGQELYFNEDGSQVKGDFAEFDGANHYYEADSGDLVKDTTRVINGVTYQFDDDGVAVTLDKVETVKSSIVISSYEFGPSVSKIILQFDKKVTPSVIHSGASVTTAGVARKILNSYVSDASGHVVYFDSSNYVTLELDVPYDADDSSKNASPFTFDLATYRNQWVSSYPVKVENLQVQADGTNCHQVIDFEQDAINNRILPDTDRFSERGTLGQYQYAAYSPTNATAGEKNPLIIWLHGIGEVGMDIDIPLLASGVVKLTEDSVQNHFTSTGSGAQKGAYVLTLQSPTAWTKTDASKLMAAIRSYVAAHPDIDSSRIYLSGVSNGGGMTLAMGVAYPNYFAALVPIAAPYDTYLSNNNETIDATSLSALKNQPMWMISTHADTTLNVDNNVLPFYKDLLQAGSQNKWLSYFETNVGEFGNHPTYNGHWSWVYFLNDEVTGVQNTENAKTWSGLSGMVATNATHGGDSQAVYKGKNYGNIFDWLNAQNKKTR